MGTTQIGLAVAKRGADKLYPAIINTASMAEGAAVIYDTGNQVKAPTGALALGFAGLIADVTPPGGTVQGTDINLQRTGIGMGLLRNGQSVTRGNNLVIAGTDGTLRAFNDGVDTNCEIIGTSELTITAGATAVAIPVNLDQKGRIP